MNQVLPRCRALHTLKGRHVSFLGKVRILTFTVSTSCSQRKLRLEIEGWQGPPHVNKSKNSVKLCCHLFIKFV